MGTPADSAWWISSSYTASSAIRTTSLEAVQGEVPPVVHGEQIAALPTGAFTREERDSVVDPALHLIGVHHGVDRPHIVRVGADSGEAGVESLTVVPGLLETECCHSTHEVDVWIVGVELAQRPDRTVAKVLCIAQEEIELVPEHQRQHVGRPVAQQLIEERCRAVPVAAEPRRDRRGMSLLAIVRFAA